MYETASTPFLSQMGIRIPTPAAADIDNAFGPVTALGDNQTGNISTAGSLFPGTESNSANQPS
jgi:hypothetical protein